MQGPDEVRIETPEQIDLALEPAGLGSRFVAWVVDSLVWVAALAVLLLLVAVVAGLLGVSLQSDWAVSVVAAVGVAVGYLILLSYDIVFELRRNGQTPGKRVAGLRVIRDSGAPIDFRSSCVRNLLRPVDMLPLFYGVGTLTALLTARRQRLGDLAAGTLVIRERALTAPAELNDVIAQYASEAYSFTPEQVQACSPADRHILRSYFNRIGEMDTRSRRQLVRRLAKLFAEKVGYEPNGELTDPGAAETFLASLYRDLDNWARHGRK